MNAEDDRNKKFVKSIELFDLIRRPTFLRCEQEDNNARIETRNTYVNFG